MTIISLLKCFDNKIVVIPPDVMPTVEGIVNEVKEKQAFYAED